MLLSESQIQIDMFYMGRGNGSRKILRCDEVNFSEEIDSSDEFASKQRLLESLEKYVFEKFISGEFTFESQRQDRAQLIHLLSDSDLIDQAYPEDEFERVFTRYELARRHLLDDDLYQLGLHGDVNTRTQAIELLKQRAE